MSGTGSYIVVDIGKTLSKVTLWTREGRMLDRQVRPNAPCEDAGLRRLDAARIAAWLKATLAAFSAHPVEAIIPVAHGAAFVALGSEGALFPPLDYEQPIPQEVMEDYRRERDSFALTGSPALPDGLNLGAQVYWMSRLYPQEMAGATLVPWSQYWAWFLTGKAVSEVTSLGCHTDLWCPSDARFSPMAERMGWAQRFAPVVKASQVVGPLRADLAIETGLAAGIQVHAGLHDSNAALLAARGFPQIARQEATILSTGTWFIAMRLAAETVSIASLSEARDTLVNVDAYGWPVPSARFMGGREIETVIQLDTRRVDIKPDQCKLMEAVPALLERGTVMMPTLTPGFGPFPRGKACWLNAPVEWAGTWYARRAAICLYAALVADTSLDLIGSKNRLLIEGRFAEAEVFVRALAALRPDTEVFVANAHNDVSFGALRLINPLLKPAAGLCRVEPLEGDLQSYRAKWRAAVARGEA
ncbi:FGGY-family carbohydrate kinase [Novosphingobium pentaromativorans]|uniref:Carbohydrate kinase, FGGY n=1 Tax=Novosphingobium pentaromativorans US6-1 TaxID=1088721 RepID=G6EH20_9SPHN|nr:carbohydrate kinase [Novosphingobium pentaromativorans]AIT81994.1 carbohydrate kinase [Novosphingobium pentaromativorans US6-1]EHJ59309.1 carbohydrate kinase, FGGY [Novosphingobium pentaromativorans US6-1]